MARSSRHISIFPHPVFFGAIFILWSTNILLWALPYPDLKSFLARPLSTRVYDRNNNLLQVIPLQNGIRREFLSINKIPRIVSQVFIISEDARFYYHRGIDLFAVIRAAAQNIIGKRNISGASTITMQLARIIANHLDDSAKLNNNFKRKISESVNAVRLEMRFTKKQILEMYLNNVPFSYRTEGVASASRTFFAKPLSDLDDAQIFSLAVITRRPSAYNPLTNPLANKKSAMNLYKKMSSSLFTPRSKITEDDFDDAVRNAKHFDYPFEMPHLVRRQSSGTNRSDIILSADIYLQKKIENLISYNVSNNRQKRITNGSAIVIDNKSGDVLAYIGSADFFNADDKGQIDGVRSLNQMGSSMKPFLYALALEGGFSPASVLADVPMTFGAQEIYVPQNFNNQFNGPQLFRYALSSSLNIPSVYLLYRLGQKNYLDFLLHGLEFYSLQNNEAGSKAGLGMALGNAPVSLEELGRAFSVFPNNGILLPLQYEKQRNGRRKKKVIESDTAAIINSFLSDQNARYLGFGRANTFKTNFPSIFKTGTANQYQSIVALGATPAWTAAVWMGNFSGDTVLGKTGSSLPAAIVREILQYLHSNTESSSANEQFTEPSGFEKLEVCAVSGLKPSDYCPARVEEYVRCGTAPALLPCTWHYEENGTFKTRYPAEYETWLLEARYAGSVDHSGTPLTIRSPQNGYVYYFDPGSNVVEQTISVEVIGGSSDTLTVQYSGQNNDGQSLRVQRPFKFLLPLKKGKQTITVQNADETKAVEFLIKGHP